MEKKAKSSKICSNKDITIANIKGIFCSHCQALNKCSIQQLKNSNEIPTCGKCGKGLEQYKHPQHITENQFEKLTKHSDLSIIVDVYADWCGPCKMYGPIFAKVAQQNWDHFNFIKLDSEKNQSFSAKYQIRGIPATLAFKNGQLVQNQSGLMQENQLQSWINQV